MEIMEKNFTPKNTENIKCKIRDFSCSNQDDMDNHILTLNHQKDMLEIPFTPKNAGFFQCKKCDFSCSKQSDWTRHLSTRKHNMEMILPNLAPKNAKKRQTYECCGCNNIFKSYSGLWKHKKNCYTLQMVEDAKQLNLTTTSNIIHSTSNTTTPTTPTTPTIPTTSGGNNEVTHKLVELIMSKNQEFMTELVTKLTYSNQDVMEKMMEIMPQIGNNSHNTNTNSHNTNNFNIQMFLNDHCKNAMNLKDFINTLPITAETYDNTIENGLTKTITSMITNGLNQLDILERPIHCTDATRKTLYVKEEDIWEKDTELMKIIMGIKTLARKQRSMLNEWKDANEGWDKDETIQMKFTNLICNSMTDIENDEKETGKIIRSISKKVYLDNEIKHDYIS